jgi:hypothetical protein
MHTIIVAVGEARLLVRRKFAESNRIEFSPSQQPLDHIHTEPTVIVVNKPWYAHTHFIEIINIISLAFTHGPVELVISICAFIT